MQSTPKVAPAAGEQLVFPHIEPPAPGATIEVAPGILWARLALPFLLDHVNIYFLEDGAGWTQPRDHLRVERLLLERCAVGQRRVRLAR